MKVPSNGTTTSKQQLEIAREAPFISAQEVGRQIGRRKQHSSKQAVNSLKQYCTTVSTQGWTIWPTATTVDDVHQYLLSLKSRVYKPGALFQTRVFGF